MLRIDSPVLPCFPAVAPRPETGSNVAQRIERTMVFMRQNLDKPLQAADLANLASMSLSHYFALFKKVTGRTPIDYLIGLRMERGRQLLETTQLSIKEIAAKLSYDDAFYFSRAFKTAHGIAPTAYRARSERMRIFAQEGAPDARLLRIPSGNLRSAPSRLPTTSASDSGKKPLDLPSQNPIPALQ